MRSRIIQLIKDRLKKKTNDWVSYSGDNYDENEYASAIETLMDGWLTFGPKCRHFEKEFCDKLGKKFGVFVNSGSSANLLMMSAARSDNGLGLKVGSKIITPPFVFQLQLTPFFKTGSSLYLLMLNCQIWTST